LRGDGGAELGVVPQADVAVGVGEDGEGGEHALEGGLEAGGGGLVDAGGVEGDDAGELLGEQAVVGGRALAVDAVGAELGLDDGGEGGEGRASELAAGPARERPAEQSAARLVHTWLPSRWCSTCWRRCSSWAASEPKMRRRDGRVEVRLVLAEPAEPVERAHRGRVGLPADALAVVGDPVLDLGAGARERQLREPAVVVQGVDGRAGRRRAPSRRLQGS
jgi:hypothetical protein